MSDGANAKKVQEEIETLTLAQRAQVGSAIGTGALALTYVSGYLTATSYLGTFSIPADASELFRAKYIYIGFEYWLSVAIFGVCFYAGSLLVRFCKVPEANEKDRRKERIDVAAELVRRRLSPDTPLEQTRALRWGGVMALISVVFSFEILFMNSTDFRDYLPLQAMFLLFLSLYQTTFYREYSKESYGWGVLYGVASVRCIRWIYSIGFGSICAALMLLKAIFPNLDSQWKLWILCGAGLVILILLLCMCMLKWVPWRFLILWILICAALVLGKVPFPHFDVPIRPRVLLWVGLSAQVLLLCVLRWLRAHHLIVRILICVDLMLGAVIFLRSDSQVRLWVLFVVVGVILILVTLVVALFVTLGSKRLKWADTKSDRGRHWLVQVIMAPWFILLAVLHAFKGTEKPVEPSASAQNSSPQQISSGQRIAARVLWILQRLDSIFVPLLAVGYCVIAWLVWMGLFGRYPAIICGYCTLIFALVVLTNILLLSRKHREREQDLGIQAGVRKALELRAKEVPQDGGPVESPIPEARWMTWARQIVPVGVLYLVSVLGFANLIYPFIPVDKAGGNFSTSSPVLIGLNNASAECNSAKLTQTVQPGREYYVIEQTADWLYLARNDSGQSPDCWKWGIFCDRNAENRGTALGQAATGPKVGALKARLPYFRPEVHQVDRRCIASVDSAP